ncbi:MAG: acetyl-CoA acetyltransferase [candidate division Zixibacteria bacterium SM23_81]|nr:MAG: acetyl-CoA acetyltransferase [candidate division Zixibacteria bacterium SM23_81]
MRDVAVIGVGMNRWGELWEKSMRDIFVEAALAAIDDAGVDHIESMYVGCMTSGLFVGQEHLGSLMADYLGVASIPATRVESACASGGVALRLGFLEVASGMSDIVLVGGVEKMTDVSGGEATYALSTAADQEYEDYQGITFPGLYAMMAHRHMYDYGTTREQLAQVAVKNHQHGSMNPLAQYPFKVTVEAVLNSVLVADPLRILDCSPITDGAAAVILCPVEMARKMSTKPMVQIIGSGQATDTIALHSRKDLTWLSATAMASERAFQMAGVGPSDLQLAEVHDCFTIAEICVIEALGLVEKGQGGKAAESGLTALGGKIPVNTSGGLKAKGHPVGATGVAQAIEIVKQLRGDAGERQVEGARLGLSQNMGGTGGSTAVHIFRRG